ncbi:MAG: SlyX family protein [Alphaproteobacteria bacterium]
MTDDFNERLNRLEESFAHHDATVHDLSGEIAKQWQTLEALVRKMEELQEKMDAVEDASPAPAADQKPPHY